jgi:hypothetical protein
LVRKNKEEEQDCKNKLETLMFLHSTGVMRMCRKLSKFMVRPGYKAAAFLTRFRLKAVFVVLALFFIIMCAESDFVFYYVITTCH